MKALVIGLGESKRFISGYDLSVGVNDCPFNVDHLVCVDPPRIFQGQRLDAIVNHQAAFYTTEHDWMQLRSGELIKRYKFRSDVSQLGLDSTYPVSICSPFVAVVHAYMMGASEIHLNGVDLYGHHSLGTPEKIERVQKDFAALKRRLNQLGVKLGLSHSQNGALKNILPVVGFVK